MKHTKKIILRIGRIANDLKILCNSKHNEKNLSYILANIHFLRDEYCNLINSLGNEDKIKKIEKSADIILSKLSRN